MDELKIKLGTPTTKKIAAKAISNLIKKKTGKVVDAEVGQLDVFFENDDIVRIKLDISLNRSDIMKILAELIS